MKEFFKKIGHWLIGHWSLPRRGFTLTEMLIVIGIIGILFAITGDMYIKQRDRANFSADIQRVIEMIKTAKNDAVTSKAYFDGTNNLVPVEGYGVKIDRTGNKVTLFANTGAAPDNAFTGADKAEETFALDTKPLSILFDANFGLYGYTTPPAGGGCPTTGGKKLSDAVIIFRPPLGDAFINGTDIGPPAASLVPFENLSMTFKTVDGLASKCITMNKVSGFPELQF